MGKSNPITILGVIKFGANNHAMVFSVGVVICDQKFESGFKSESESTNFFLNLNPDSAFQGLNPNPNPAQNGLNSDLNH